LWTAPARARRGDLAVLYCTTDHEWMAVGRVVHDSVRSRRDGKWWSYVQWLPVRRPLAYDEARRVPELAHWRKLEQMNGRHALIADTRVADQLLRRLVRHDWLAAARLRAWKSGRARFPRVSRDDLFDAWFEPSPPLTRLPDDHERHLADEIEALLIGRRRARRRRDDDALRIGTSSVVCLQTRLCEKRFPDLVLVDRTRERTLLLIEVKRYATLSDLRAAGTVVDQVREYRHLLKPHVRRWRIRPVIVATRVNDNVVDAACAAGIEVWRYNPETRRFKTLGASYQ
jgi:hypothetical protein